MLVVDRSSCTLYELYRAFFKGGGGAHWNADSGARWDLRSTARRPDSWTSADAAGLPIFPGLVRYDEVAAGHARPRDPGHLRQHPQRLGPPRLALRRRHLRPATPRRWARDCDSRPATASAASAAAPSVIAEALKRYGMIVADNGSNWYFSGSSDRRWDDENLNQLKRIPGSAFQVVKSAARPHSC